MYNKLTGVASIEALQQTPSPQARKGLSVHLPPLADFRAGNKASLISPTVLEGCVRALEFLVTAVTGAGVAFAYVPRADLLANTAYPFVVLSVAISTLAVFQLFGLYQVRAFGSIFRQIPRIVMGWTLVFAMLVAAMFFLKLGHSFLARLAGGLVRNWRPCACCHAYRPRRPRQALGTRGTPLPARRGLWRWTGHRTSAAPARSRSGRRHPHLRRFR